MFDIIANALTLTASIALPTFLSYKALQSIPSHPRPFTDDASAQAALLTPWLTYWITNSLLLATHSALHPLLSLIPLYPWLRLGAHTYLLVPGSAERIYQTHIRPFLHRHEREIEAFIADSHTALKAQGLDYLRRAVDWVRSTVLGEQNVAARAAPPPTPQPADASPHSYVQALLARFSAASTSAQAAAPQNHSASSSSSSQVQAQVNAAFDVFDKLKAQVAAATASASASAASSSAGPTAPAPSLASTTTDMKKSRSETEFEKIEREDTGESASSSSHRSGHGWGSWMWGGSGKASKAKGE